MAGVDPRRQYDQSSYQSPRGYGANIPGTSLPERYGQSQTQARQIPTTESAGSTGAAAGQALRGVYPYAQGQQQYAPHMQGTSMGYQAEFQQDTQRQQQFPAYCSDMIYSLPAQVQPAQQPSNYDVVQQPYQPRQSTAIEVLSNQFGVPQYYNTGEPTSAASQIPQTYASPQYQQQHAFQQSLSSNRPTEGTSYATGVGEYTQLNMSGALEPAEAAQDPSAGEEPYKTYLESLKQTYQFTYEGRLVEAGQRLLELSDWLIGHATELGLTRDEADLQSQRLKLWTDFNNCWLAVLQRQKDITQEMIDSNEPLPENQTLLQEAFLERMARELVRMCDVMERHGLVDYEMGIWEEEIMNVLLDCLHLFEGDPEEPSGTSSRSNPPLPSRASK